ncbi:MAG: hypothetical protein DDT20_00686 [Firmicutes bacterium]|nr:hypothetical protein [Bacillota bacterium]
MAITVNVRKPAGPVFNYASGALSAASVSANFPTSGVAGTPLILNLGFEPRYFKIQNTTSRVSHEWFEGMAAGFYLLETAAGTKTYVNTNASIVVFGSTVSLSTNINTALVDNELSVWEARG